MPRRAYKAPVVSIRPKKSGKAPQQKIPVWSWRDAILKSSMHPSAKLICLVISCHLSDCGKAWPIPQKEIIEGTGLSNASVTKYTQVAVDDGLLVATSSLNAKGQRQVTQYKAAFPGYVELRREALEDQPDLSVKDGPDVSLKDGPALRLKGQVPIQTGKPIQGGDDHEKGGYGSGRGVSTRVAATTPPKPRTSKAKTKANAKPSAWTPEKRQRAYARKVLENEAGELQAMRGPGARNNALFAAGCKLGKFVHHGFLPRSEVEAALLGACETNGLIADDGLRQCRQSLESGLSKAVNDLLPDLGDRP